MTPSWDASRHRVRDEGHLYTYGRQDHDAVRPGTRRRRWRRLGRRRGGRGDRAAPQPCRGAPEHLEAGAKRVILCVPPADEPGDLTVVMGGVNDEQLHPSRASWRSAPTPRDGQLRRSHHQTGRRRVRHRARCSSPPSTPTPTPAPGRRARTRGLPPLARRRREHHPDGDQLRREILEQVMPAARREDPGMALNVPVPNGSMVDMVMFTQTPITMDSGQRGGRAAGIDAQVRQASSSTSHDPIVSSDVQARPYSGHLRQPGHHGHSAGTW